MRLTKVTDPTTLPLALNDLKDHLRIERDELDYDDDLTILIRTAASFIESDCHVTLINTQYTAKWDDWPQRVVWHKTGDYMRSGHVYVRDAYERLMIPNWPIVSVDSIQYKDTDGTTQTWSSSLYRTELVQSPATIVPAIDEDWPVLQRDAIDAVTVTFTAGFGSAASDMPWQVQAMIKLLCSHWFKNREAVGSSNVPYKKSYDALADHIRENEWTSFLEQ